MYIFGQDSEKSVFVQLEQVVLQLYVRRVQLHLGLPLLRLGDAAVTVVGIWVEREQELVGRHGHVDDVLDGIEADGIAVFSMMRSGIKLAGCPCIC